MKSHRVMLVDDHDLVRAGIAELIKSMDCFSIVAQCSNGRDAVAAAREHTPDVIVMDISLQGMNGISAASHIRKYLPDTRILMLTMHTDEARVSAALAAGANGYLVKGATRTELEFALNSVLQGRTYLSPSVSTQLVNSYIKYEAGAAAAPSDLTLRQQEILQLVCEGHNSREIAELLHLAVKTVESHRSQIMERLDIRDVPGLVKYAIRIGLVSVDP